MALYPSLEDMKVDQILQVRNIILNNYIVVFLKSFNVIMLLLSSSNCNRNSFGCIFKFYIVKQRSPVYESVNVFKSKV